MLFVARNRRMLVGALVMLVAAVAVGVASAVLTKSVVIDSNVVREEVVNNAFTPSADQPTFASGWHTHPGLAVVQVQVGKLRITQNCQSKWVRAGDTSIEVPYMPVNAVANEAVKWTTTFVLANSTVGSPDRTPVTEPVCPAGGDGNDTGDHQN